MSTPKKKIRLTIPGHGLLLWRGHRDRYKRVRWLSAGVLWVFFEDALDCAGVKLLDRISIEAADVVSGA